MILEVVVFYGLTLVLTFLIGGLQQEAGLLPGLIFLPQWGPGIAGLITMWVFRKRDGLRITFFDRRMPLPRYLGALVLPLDFGLLTFLFARLVLGDAQSVPVTVTGVAMMLAGALGEEIGWRGYLHRRIVPHLSPLVSSLVVGLLWMPFHVQLWPGGVPFLLFFALGTVSLSVMAYALLAEYEFNVLGATLFHLGTNLGTTLFYGHVLSFTLPLMVAYGTIAAALAAVVMWLRRDLFSATGPENR
jgi:membrane protease YdiL (CAAX protease family)